ncbi:hypothetical protein AB0I77_49215 [Streptomyces sp. NPDC050619]|uniref:hypothetical protein n=1 Tax=Streptomyces sp. NPDC050619 TaxID=3157214 RepID=UPI0034272D7C
MTIEVYRINPQTGARTEVRSKHTVKPATVPDLSSGYPPCACPNCKGKGSRGRLQFLVADANRRSRGEA